MDQARAIGDQKIIGHGMANIGNILEVQGRYPEALEVFTRMLELVERLGDRRNIALACGNIGYILQQQGRLGQALPWLVRQLALARELGDKRSINYAVGNLGTARLLRGEFDAALEDLGQQLAISTELGDTQCIADATANIGIIHKHRQQHAAAERALSEAVRLGRSAAGNYNLAQYLNELADLYLGTGRPALAEPLVRQAAELLQQQPRPELMLANKVLTAKIMATSDQMEAVRRLRDLLASSQDIGQRALLAFELFQLSLNEHDKQQAIDLLATVQQQSEAIQFKAMHAALTAIRTHDTMANN